MVGSDQAAPNDEEDGGWLGNILPARYHSIGNPEVWWSTTRKRSTNGIPTAVFDAYK